MGWLIFLLASFRSLWPLTVTKARGFLLGIAGSEGVVSVGVAGRGLNEVGVVGWGVASVGVAGRGLNPMGVGEVGVAGRGLTTMGVGEVGVAGRGLTPFAPVKVVGWAPIRAVPLEVVTTSLLGCTSKAWALML